MKLFIVESPNKCGKIRGYLGSDYKVTASVGHIRSIPKKGINVDIKNDFTPKYEVSSDKKKVVAEIKKLAKECDEIILATDSDREGEGIAWHIYEILNKADQKKCTRIAFNEITKRAILEALDNKREIDMDLVDAQKARQVLDRLIGYKISPVLWYEAKLNGSSAGRVQSIALKLICEREKEIKAFKPEDYWFIEALLEGKDGEFKAKVVTKEKDNRYKDDKLAKDDLEALKKARYKVASIEKKEKLNKPYPPFDTTSLYMACSSLFGWSASKSKTLAQKIYESGKCTYIRTDSYAIADDAMKEVRSLIKESDASYLPSKPVKYSKKSKAAAQEAHECIRPTHIEDAGDDIGDKDEKKMYKLIRDRFIACQMKPMIVDTVKYTVKTDSKHTLVAQGQSIKFDGWFKVYSYSKAKEVMLPVVEEREELKLNDINKTKHTTKPPPRFNDGSLVKKMEDEGVGRPSTRASIIKALEDKEYVNKDKKAFIPTILGMKICDFLAPNFKDFFMDIKYTAALEDELDEIAKGNKTYLETVNSVHDLILKHTKDIKGMEREVKEPVKTGHQCEKCDDGEVVEKDGRYGTFFTCNNYPKCKTVYVCDEDGNYSVKKKAKVKTTGKKCPECEKAGRDGELVERTNRKNGNKFLGCNKYPKCKHAESVE